MNYLVQYIILPVGLCLLFLGCGKPVPSKNISTSEVYFTMALKNQNEHQIECYTRASVKDSFGNSVEMSTGDYLTCNGFLMQKDTDVFGHYVYYHTNVPINADQHYEIKFYKEGQEFASSFVNTADLLKPISPVEGFVLKPSDYLRIDWQKSKNSGGKMNISASSNKLNVGVSSQEIDDQLQSTVLPNFDSALSGVQISEQYPIALEIKRTFKGNKSNSINGHIEAVQLLTVNGFLVP